MNSDASLNALAKELSDFVARRHTTRKADGSTVTSGTGIKLPDGTIVEDGDTIRTKDGRIIRDSTGDTPEIAKVITGKHGEVRTGQASETGGEEAKQARATLMQDGYTVGDTNGTDDYGRTVGQTVDAQGRDIGVTLAEAGLATPTVEHYNNRAGLAAYTDYIRESGGVSAGMWRDPAIEGQRLAAKRGREQDGKSLPPGLVPPKDGYVRDNGTAANSWDRGVDMTQGMGYGFLEAVGEATGIDAVAEFGKAGRERNAAERDLHPAKVPTLFHAETTGDYATYAVEKIIENTPNMAVTMATAALASVAAPAAAGLLAPAAAAGVRAAVPTIAGIAVTPKAAGIAGALASSYVLNAGEVQENLKEVDPNASTGGLALIAGVPAAALDAPLIGTVASALTAPLQKGLMSGVKEIAKRTGKAAVKGFAAEAPTEGGQEVNSILFEEILGGDKYDVFSRRNLERVVDATAAGGLSGMATTATMHLGREGLTAATGGYAKPNTPPQDPNPTPQDPDPAPQGQPPAPQDPNPTPQDPTPASSLLDNPTLVPEPKAALVRQVEIVAESDNGLHTMYVESSNPSYEAIRSKATLESANVNIVEVPEGIPGIPSGLLVTSVDGVNKTPQTAAELESFGISANNSAEDNLAALDKILHFGADTPADTGVWGKSWLLDNPTNGLAVVVRDAKNGNAVVKSRLVPADNPAEIGRTEGLFKRNFSDPRYTVERASVEDVLNERVATQEAPTEAPAPEASTPVVVPPVADPAPEVQAEAPAQEAPTEAPVPEVKADYPPLSQEFMADKENAVPEVVADLGGGIRITAQKSKTGKIVPATLASQREVLHIVDENGRGSWFYRSFTGTSGKQQGAWFPIGGVAYERDAAGGVGGLFWIIKGTSEDLVDSYGREDLAAFAKRVNEVLPHDDAGVDEFLESRLGVSYSTMNNDTSGDYATAPSYLLPAGKSSFSLTNEEKEALRVDASNKWRAKKLSKLWGARGQKAPAIPGVKAPEASPVADPAQEVKTEAPAPEVKVEAPASEVKVEAPAPEAKADPNALPLSDPSKPTKSPHPLRKLANYSVGRARAAFQFITEGAKGAAEKFVEFYKGDKRDELKHAIRFINSRESAPARHLPENASPKEVYQRIESLWNAKDSVIVGRPTDNGQTRSDLEEFDPAYPSDLRLKVDSHSYSTIYQALLAALVREDLLLEGSETSMRVHISSLNERLDGKRHEAVTSKIRELLATKVKGPDNKVMTLNEHLNTTKPSPDSIVSKLVNLYLQRFSHEGLDPEVRKAAAGLMAEYRKKIVRMNLAAFGSRDNPSVLDLLSANSSTGVTSAYNRNLAGWAVMLAGDWLSSVQDNPLESTPQSLVTEGTSATSLPEAFFEPAQSHLMAARALLFNAFKAAKVPQPTITGDADVLTEEEQEQVVTGHLKALYIVGKDTLFIAPKVLENLVNRSGNYTEFHKALHAVFHEGGHYVFEFAVRNAPERADLLTKELLPEAKGAKFSELTAEQKRLVHERAAHIIAGALARRFNRTLKSGIDLVAGSTTVAKATRYALQNIANQLANYYLHLKATYPDLFSSTRLSTLADQFLDAVVAPQAPEEKAAPPVPATPGKSIGGIGKIATAISKARKRVRTFKGWLSRERSTGKFNIKRLFNAAKLLSSLNTGDPTLAVELLRFLLDYPKLRAAADQIPELAGGALPQEFPADLAKALEGLQIPPQYAADVEALEGLTRSIAMRLGHWDPSAGSSTLRDMLAEEGPTVDETDAEDRIRRLSWDMQRFAGQVDALEHEYKATLEKARKATRLRTPTEGPRYDRDNLAAALVDLRNRRKKALAIQLRHQAIMADAIARSEEASRQRGVSSLEREYLAVSKKVLEWRKAQDARRDDPTAPLPTEGGAKLFADYMRLSKQLKKAQKAEAARQAKITAAGDTLGGGITRGNASQVYRAVVKADPALAARIQELMVLISNELRSKVSFWGASKKPKLGRAGLSQNKVRDRILALDKSLREFVSDTRAAMRLRNQGKLLRALSSQQALQDEAAATPGVHALYWRNRPEAYRLYKLRKLLPEVAHKPDGFFSYDWNSEFGQMLESKLTPENGFEIFMEPAEILLGTDIMEAFPRVELGEESSSIAWTILRELAAKHSPEAIDVKQFKTAEAYRLHVLRKLLPQVADQPDEFFSGEESSRFGRLLKARVKSADERSLLMGPADRLAFRDLKQVFPKKDLALRKGSEILRSRIEHIARYYPRAVYLTQFVDPASNAPARTVGQKALALASKAIGDDNRAVDLQAQFLALKFLDDPVALRTFALRHLLPELAGQPDEFFQDVGGDSEVYKALEAKKADLTLLTEDPIEGVVRLLTPIIKAGRTEVTEGMIRAGTAADTLSAELRERFDEVADKLLKELKSSKRFDRGFMEYFLDQFMADMANAMDEAQLAYEPMFDSVFHTAFDKISEVNSGPARAALDRSRAILTAVENSLESAKVALAELQNLLHTANLDEDTVGRLHDNISSTRDAIDGFRKEAKKSRAEIWDGFRQIMPDVLMAVHALNVARDRFSSQSLLGDSILNPDGTGVKLPELSTDEDGEVTDSVGNVYAVPGEWGSSEGVDDLEAVDALREVDAIPATQEELAAELIAQVDTGQATKADVVDELEQRVGDLAEEGILLPESEPYMSSEARFDALRERFEFLMRRQFTPESKVVWHYGDKQGVGGVFGSPPSLVKGVAGFPSKEAAQTYIRDRLLRWLNPSAVYMITKLDNGMLAVVEKVFDEGGTLAAIRSATIAARSPTVDLDSVVDFYALAVNKAGEIDYSLRRIHLPTLLYRLPYLDSHTYDEVQEMGPYRFVTALNIFFGFMLSPENTASGTLKYLLGYSPDSPELNALLAPREQGVAPRDFTLKNVTGGAAVIVHNGVRYSFGEAENAVNLYTLPRDTQADPMAPTWADYERKIHAIQVARETLAAWAATHPFNGVSSVIYAVKSAVRTLMLTANEERASVAAALAAKLELMWGNAGGVSLLDLLTKNTDPITRPSRSEESQNRLIAHAEKQLRETNDLDLRAMADEIVGAMKDGRPLEDIIHLVGREQWSSSDLSGGALKSVLAVYDSPVEIGVPVPFLGAETVDSVLLKLSDVPLDPVTLAEAEKIIAELEAIKAEANATFDSADLTTEEMARKHTGFITKTTGLINRLEALIDVSNDLLDNLDKAHFGKTLASQVTHPDAPKEGLNALSFFAIQTARWNMTNQYWVAHPRVAEAFKGMTLIQYAEQEGLLELKNGVWVATEKGIENYESAKDNLTHVTEDSAKDLRRQMGANLDPRVGIRFLLHYLHSKLEGVNDADEVTYFNSGLNYFTDRPELMGKDITDIEAMDLPGSKQDGMFDNRDTEAGPRLVKDQTVPYSSAGLFGEDALNGPQVSVRMGKRAAAKFLGGWLEKVLKALGIETRFKLLDQARLGTLRSWAEQEISRLIQSVGMPEYTGEPTGEAMHHYYTATVGRQRQQMQAILPRTEEDRTRLSEGTALLKKWTSVADSLTDLSALLRDITVVETRVADHGAAIIYADFKNSLFRTPVIVLSNKVLENNSRALDTLAGKSKLIREVAIRLIGHELGHYIHRSILSNPIYAVLLDKIAKEIGGSLDTAMTVEGENESIANQFVMYLTQEEEAETKYYKPDPGSPYDLWMKLKEALKAALTKLYKVLKGEFGYSESYKEFINDLYKRASNNEKVLYGGTVQSSKFYMDGPRVDLFHEELDHGGRAAARWVGRMTSAGWNKLLSNSKTGLPALRVADAAKSVGELAGSAWSSVISSHIVRMKELNLRTGSRAAMLLLNASGHTPDTPHAYTFPEEGPSHDIPMGAHSVPERLRAELGLFADQFEALAERIAKDNPPKGWFRKATQWIHKNSGPRQSYYVGIKGTTIPLGEFTTRKEAYNEKLRLQQDPAHAGKTFTIVKAASSAYKRQVGVLLHRYGLREVITEDEADRTKTILLDMNAVSANVEGFSKAVAALLGWDYSVSAIRSRVSSLVGYLRAENGAISVDGTLLQPADARLSADYQALLSKLTADPNNRGGVAAFLQDGQYTLARQALELLSEIRYHAVNRLGVRLEQSGEYLPLILDIETVMPNKAEFVQTIAAILQDAPLAGTKVQRAENLVEFFMDNNGVVLDLNTRGYTDHTQVFADYNALLMAFASNLDVRKEISKYLLDDVMGMLVHYQHALFKKGVTDLYYGKIDDMGAMDPIGRLKELLQSDRGLTSAEREWLMNVVYPMLMGRFNRGSFHPAVRRLFSATMLYQFIRLLPFATLSSFIDPGVTALRLGLKNTWDGLQAVRKEGYGALYEAARLLGIVMEEGADHILSDAMNAQYMTLGVKKVSEAFFRAIGLTQWTNLMRVVAASASVNYLRDLNIRLEEADRLTAQSGTLAPAVRRSIARAQREFQELQVSRETLRDWLQSGTTTEELLRNARLRGGFSEMNALLQRLNSDSVLRPNIGDRPHWANNPLMSLIWMLKQFMWLFHNKVLVRVWEETKAADRPGLLRLMPAITMIAFLMPLAFLGFGLRKLLTGDLDRQLEKTPGELTAEMFERSGVPGVFQLLIDAERSADAKKVAFLTFLGPVVEQASGFFMEPMDLWVARSIPISSSSPWVRNKLREYLREYGNDEE